MSQSLSDEKPRGVRPTLRAATILCLILALALFTLLTMDIATASPFAPGWLDAWAYDFISSFNTPDPSAFGLLTLLPFVGLISMLWNRWGLARAVSLYAVPVAFADRLLVVVLGFPWTASNHAMNFLRWQYPDLYYAPDQYCHAATCSYVVSNWLVLAASAVLMAWLAPRYLPRVPGFLIGVLSISVAVVAVISYPTPYAHPLWPVETAYPYGNPWSVLNLAIAVPVATVAMLARDRFVRDLGKLSWKSPDGLDGSSPARE